MSESDADRNRARFVGINHVVLDVGDVEGALEFYGSIFEFERRGRFEEKAFLDVGDQFIALAETDDAGGTDVADDGDAERTETDDAQHVGLVVDDADLVAERIDELDVDRVGSSDLDFRDPWGNWIQVVEYSEVQFTKAHHVLEGMGLSDLEKSESAVEELAEKGMAPDAGPGSGSD